MSIFDRIFGKKEEEVNKNLTVEEFLDKVDNALDRLLAGNDTDLIYAEWYTYTEDNGSAVIGFEDARFKEESDEEYDESVDLTRFYETGDVMGAARQVLKEMEEYAERYPEGKPTHQALNVPANNDDYDDYEDSDRDDEGYDVEGYDEGDESVSEEEQEEPEESEELDEYEDEEEDRDR